MIPGEDGFRGGSAARVAPLLATARLGSGGWWVAWCPFCVERVGSAARKMSLGINDETGIWNCFRCHAKGCLLRDDKKALQRRAKESQPKGRDNPGCAPEGYWPLWTGDGLTSEALAPARDYLEKRRVSPRVIREAQIGATMRGKFAGRIIVPVLPAQGVKPTHGDWWGFVARTWLPKDSVALPYLYPDGMPKRAVLYNQAALDEDTETPVIVVEGAFDTFPVWPDGVALFGDANDEQVAALRAAKRPIAVVLDGDAWRKGVGLAQLLRFDGQRAGAVVLPPKLDPDEIPVALLREASWECIERGVVRL